jgi:hypothetical protein
MCWCPYFKDMRNVNKRYEPDCYYGGSQNQQSVNYRDYARKNFTTEEAFMVARYLDIKFDKFDLEQFRAGLVVELEHGLVDPHTNVTNDDPILSGKIALAHLNEYPDYYKRLAKMEEEAEEYWEHKA